MFYVFGTVHEGQLIYFIDPKGANIFRFDNEEDKEFSLEVAQSTYPNLRAYKLIEE